MSEINISHSSNIKRSVIESFLIVKKITAVFDLLKRTKYFVQNAKYNYVLLRSIRYLSRAFSVYLDDFLMPALLIKFDFFSLLSSL